MVVMVETDIIRELLAEEALVQEVRVALVE